MTVFCHEAALQKLLTFSFADRQSLVKSRRYSDVSVVSMDRLHYRIFTVDKLSCSERRVRCPLLHPFVAPPLFWPQPLFPIITTLFAARLPLSHAHPASCLSQVHSFVLCVNNNIKIHIHSIGKK